MEMKGKKVSHPLDDPMILSQLFYIRKTMPASREAERVFDGSIPIESGVELGYRLYLHQPQSPLILFFHGNGEIASDYDDLAPFYHVAGASLMVIDYRGYGWSSGLPLATRLLPDAEKALLALPRVLNNYGTAPRALFVKGRSLGSSSAVYLAFQHPDRVNGLIIESAYADAPSLFRRLQIEIPPVLAQDPQMPFNNLGKLAHVSMPLLVIHGSRDAVFPPVHAQDLYEAAPDPRKELLIIDNASHNSVMFVNVAAYFDAIKRFVSAYTPA